RRREYGARIAFVRTNQSANTRGGTSRTRRTADLRVTASTRIGAPPRGKSRPRRAGALARRGGALTPLIQKRQRSLLRSSAADGADESSGAIMGVSQARSTFNPRGCLRTP